MNLTIFNFVISICLILSNLIEIQCYAKPSSSDTISSQTNLLERLFWQQSSASRVKRSEADNCHTVKTTASGLQVIYRKTEKTAQFYMKPDASFKQLVVQLSLQNIWRLSSKIYDDKVEFTWNDWQESGLSDSSEWLKVQIELDLYERRNRPDNHRITVNIASSTNATWHDVTTTNKWWRWYAFKAIVISGEGGCEWVFGCDPSPAIAVTENGITTVETESPSLEFDYEETLGLLPERYNSDIGQENVGDPWLYLNIAILIGFLLLLALVVVIVFVLLRRYHEKKTTKNTLEQNQVSSRDVEENIYNEILPLSALETLKRKYMDLGIEGFEKNHSPPPITTRCPLKPPTLNPAKGNSDIDHNWHKVLEGNTKHSYLTHHDVNAATLVQSQLDDIARYENIKNNLEKCGDDNAYVDMKKQSQKQ